MIRYAMMFLLGEVAVLSGIYGHVYVGFIISAVAGLAAVIWGKEDKKEKTNVEN